MIHVNEKEQALVNSETGEIIRPTCWVDLIAYYNYLNSRDKKHAAQSMLQEVFKGEKVISKMISNVQKHGLLNGD